MNALLHPRIAECEHCPGWEVACSSDAERRRLIDKHTQRLHAATADSIGELLYDDPAHQGDREAVEAAIRTVARYYNGIVDVNKVRPQIPSWVQPQMIAAVYGSWARRGLLVPLGKVRSTDTKSRNSNKEARVYRLREVS